MVFGDLGDSTPQTFPVRAPVQERFIAFCFDVLLIVPCISFTSLLCLKFVGSLSETEHFAAFAFLALVQWVWVQAFFIAWRGATPGKEILKLKVVSTEEPGQIPSWDQALLRSMLWMFEICYLGIPMLKVFREEWRRPFHDRLPGTVVITQKDVDSPVTEHEKGLAKWLFYGANGFFAVWFLTLFFFVAPKVKSFDRAPASTERAEVPGCKDMLTLQSDRHGRAEQAILLHEEKLIDRECLDEEIEHAMDHGDATERALASVGMAYAHRTDRKFAEEYLAEACVLAPGVAGPCRVASAFYSVAPAGSPVKDPGLLERYLSWKKNPVSTPDFLADFPFVAEARAVEKLTANGGLEEAVATYVERRSEWPARLTRSVAAELCLAELTNACDTRVVATCEAVAKAVREDRGTWNLKETAGWIEYQRCQNEPRGSLDEWRGLADARPDLYRFAKLLLGDREKGMPQGQAVRFIEDADIPAELRSRALAHLAHEVARKGNDSGADLLVTARAIGDESVLGKLAEGRARSAIEGAGIVVIGPAFRPVRIPRALPVLKADDNRAPASATDREKETE